MTMFARQAALRIAIDVIPLARALAVAISLTLAGVACANSARADSEPRHASMVLDGNSGQVLHESAADEPRHPASLTKMMTLYLLFETIDQGRLAMDSLLTVSTAAASVAPSKLELQPGDQIAVSDAIKALITKSANDMAVAVAERIAGSERAFAELMNRRAAAIGLAATHFENASGLPDRDQVTTARDMVTLALRLNDDFPDYVPLFSLKTFTYRGKTYKNHNTLMFSYPGMDGMKTGYTKDSGFNLVATVHRDGRFLIGAVFGGATANARNAHMRTLLQRAFIDAATEKTRKPIVIARPRPAVRPAAKIAVVPEPKPANPAPPPKPVVAAAPRAAPRPVVAKAQPQPAPEVEPAAAVPPKDVAPATPADSQAPAAATPAPPIEIAKVRAVPMPAAPETAEQRPASKGTLREGTGESSPATMAAAAPRLDFAALRRAIDAPGAPAQPAPPAMAAPAPTAPPAANETVVPRAGSAGVVPGRRPSTLEAQVAMLQDEPPAAPVGITSALPAGTTARAPSTLEAQAATLAYTTPQSAEVAGAPRPLPTAAAAGANWQLKGAIREETAAGRGYLVDIGGYPTAADAERRLSAALSQMNELLAGHPVAMEPASSGGSTLYRARFAGFDEAKAKSACQELTRMNFSCAVVRHD